MAKSEAQDDASRPVHNIKQPKLRLVSVVYISLGLKLSPIPVFYGESYFGLSFFVLSNRGMVEQTVNGNILTGFWDLWFGDLGSLLFWLG